MLETRPIPSDIKLETLTYCDLCGSDRLAQWDSARSNTLSRCKSCGLVFTNPRIASSTDKDRALYTESYFQQASRMTEKLIEARRTSYRQEISALEFHTPGGRILDVGCGVGLFLECFDNVKWKKFGCDVSSYGLDEAKKRGVITFHGEFEKLEFGPQPFDVIYFRASLHHAYRPKECIEKAFSLLRPGGTIAIAMSNNVNGLCGRLFKAHVKSYEQAHNYLFSKPCLKMYLERAGFKILESRYPYFGTGYSSAEDLASLVPTYLKYLFLRFTGRLNREGTYDFASPPFYGNYVNIYAKKP